MSSIVPPYCELSEVREIANARRRIIFEVSPPTEIATKLPGRQLFTISPTLSRIWWYAPTRLLETTVTICCTALLLIVAISEQATLGLGLRITRWLEVI